LTAFKDLRLEYSTFGVCSFDNVTAGKTKLFHFATLSLINARGIKAAKLRLPHWPE
jgi:hypothetical protein